jgi:hypothetical protein
MLLERTAASSFITNATRTPVVEYIWSATGGAGGLENLVVASSLIELGGTFKTMTPLSLGGTYSSVAFSGTYRGPVLFVSVQTVGTPGQGSTPTPQAREQYELYDRPPTRRDAARSRSSTSQATTSWSAARSRATWSPASRWARSRWRSARRTVRSPGPSSAARTT